MSVIEFTVPLPPVTLRANGRAHWRTKTRDADTYSVAVLLAWESCEGIISPQRGVAWKKATVTYRWRYAGVAPDLGNLGGNTKYLQDILCMAPKSKAGKNRWYLGLVEDDKGITPVYELEKVAHKSGSGRTGASMGGRPMRWRE